jgi:hypothetical protein
MPQKPTRKPARSSLRALTGGWSGCSWAGDGTGRRRYHSRVVHGAKKDARRLLTKFQREIDQGEFVEPSDRPLEDYLTEWLRTSVAARVSGKSASDYESLARRHILPGLGMRKLSQLSSADVQRLYNDLLGRGLSPRTVRYVTRSCTLHWTKRCAGGSSPATRPRWLTSPATGRGRCGRFPRRSWLAFWTRPARTGTSCSGCSSQRLECGPASASLLSGPTSPETGCGSSAISYVRRMGAGSSRSPRRRGRAGR